MSQQLGPLQTAWLEQLESGKILQTKNILYDPVADAYCCLGVACRVMGLEPILHRDAAAHIGTWGEFLGEKYTLPHEVRDEMKFWSSNGARHALHTLPGEALTDENDRGATFSEIAARVRANPTQYFSAPA